MIRFVCPSCKNILQAPPERAGGDAACPKCKQQIRVPSPAGRTANPARPTPAVSAASPPTPVRQGTPQEAAGAGAALDKVGNFTRRTAAKAKAFVESEATKAKIDKAKTTWRRFGFKTKAGIVAGALSLLLGALLFSCLLFGWMFGKSRIAGTPGGLGIQTNTATGDKAGSKKWRRPATGHSSASGGGTADDADLMDMEQRYKALVNRVHPGMTTDQVEAILGSPDDTKGAGKNNIVNFSCEV